MTEIHERITSNASPIETSQGVAPPKAEQQKITAERSSFGHTWSFFPTKEGVLKTIDAIWQGTKACFNCFTAPAVWAGKAVLQAKNFIAGRINAAINKTIPSEQKQVNLSQEKLTKPPSISMTTGARIKEYQGETIKNSPQALKSIEYTMKSDAVILKDTGVPNLTLADGYVKDCPRAIYTINGHEAYDRAALKGKSEDEKQEIIRAGHTAIHQALGGNTTVFQNISRLLFQNLSFDVVTHQYEALLPSDKKAEAQKILEEKGADEHTAFVMMNCGFNLKDQGSAYGIITHDDGKITLTAQTTYSLQPYDENFTPHAEHGGDIATTRTITFKPGVLEEDLSLKTPEERAKLMTIEDNYSALIPAK